MEKEINDKKNRENVKRIEKMINRTEAMIRQAQNSSCNERGKEGSQW